MKENLILNVTNLVKDLDSKKLNSSVDKTKAVNDIMKTCIKNGKNHKSAGLNGKQHIAIIKLYMTTTGKVLSQNQIVYLKTINKVQASNIISALNKYNKTLK